MRPISLKIEGFTSFKTEIDIDFSELEVFAITGDNGAGKSSILEAMLFALFGKTHRMGKEKKDLVSLGADKAAVHFEFSAESRRYRVTRSFKTKGSPFMKLELQTETGWTTIADQTRVNEEVERILRLSFDAFTKAVLIPQGHFDALLKPREPKERRKILIDLFDLGVYDLMRIRANEIVKHAEGEEAQILTSLQMRYRDATPEKREEIAAEKKSLTSASKDLQKKRTRLQKDLEHVREVLQIKTGYDQMLLRVEELKKRLPQFEAKTRTALQALDEAKGAEKEIPALDAEVQMLARSAEKLRQLAQKETDEESLRAALRKMETELGRLNKDHEELERKLKMSTAATGKLHQDIEKHPFQEPLFQQLQSLYEEAIKLGSFRKELQKLLAKIELDPAELQSLEKSGSDLKASAAKLEKNLKTEQVKADRSRMEGQVLELKMHLHSGEECPVCGTVVKAPAVVSADRIGAMQDAHTASRQRIADLEHELSGVREKEAKISATAQLRKEILRENEKHSQDLKKLIGKENAKLQKALGLSKEEEADAFIQEQYEQQKSLLSEHRRLREALQKQERDHQLIDRDLHSKSADLRVKTAEVEQKKNELKVVTAEMQALQKEMPDWLERDIPVKQALKASEQRRSNAVEQIAALRKNKESAAVALAEIQRDESHAKDASRSEENKLSELEKEIRKMSQEESAFSELLLETLKSQYKTAEDEAGRVDRRLGEVTQSLDQMDQLLKELAEQNVRLAAVRKDRETYGLLSRHLASNQLQDYVVSTLLEQLLGSANVFLKDLTQGRYLLQLQKESFVVLDSWSSGQSRIVETLSGGESFVASLALALALSDFVKGGALLESIFIDEGFGSLHKDKLDLVYEALGALSGTGKMIGLVTHIEELAARFATRMHVTNSPSGSRVALVRNETQW